MRQNLIAMLADLFNMLEVHPVKSVKYPGSGEYIESPYLPNLPRLSVLHANRPVMGVCGHNIIRLNCLLIFLYIIILKRTKFAEAEYVTLFYINAKVGKGLY